MMEKSHDKCIVHGCLNHKDEGAFVGDLCLPCYSMVTRGKITSPGETWIHRLFPPVTSEGAVTDLVTGLPIAPCPFCGVSACVEEVNGVRGAAYSVGCCSEDIVDCYGYQSLTTFSRRGGRDHGVEPTK